MPGMVLQNNQSKKEVSLIKGFLEQKKHKMISGHIIQKHTATYSQSVYEIHQLNPQSIATPSQ